MLDVKKNLMGRRLVLGSKIMGKKTLARQQQIFTEHKAVKQSDRIKSSARSTGPTEGQVQQNII